MRLYRHDSPEQYRRAQVRMNRRKRNNHWVGRSELREIAKVVQGRHEQLEFGICHGVRTGLENRELSRLLGIEVVGTDLVGRDQVLEMDFHEMKPEWAGKANFVYSNSLDHSHDPRLALHAWMRSLRPGGLLLIHVGIGHEHLTLDAADCFGASKDEYRSLLEEFGKVDEVEVRDRTLFVVEVQ